MKNILIAEDERALRNVLRDELASDKFNIFEAKDGVEALKVLKNSKIDLIILDVMMPGVSGTKVAETIKSSDEIAHKPEIIILSNKDDTETVTDALSAKAFTYLVKSNTPIDKIVEIVNEKFPE